MRLRPQYVLRAPQGCCYTYRVRFMVSGRALTHQGPAISGSMLSASHSPGGSTLTTPCPDEGTNLPSEQSAQVTQLTHGRTSSVHLSLGPHPYTPLLFILKTSQLCL